MTESDSGEGEAGESETGESANEVVEETDHNNDDSQNSVEKADLEQILKDDNENLNEEQKAELDSLIAKSNIKVEDLPNWLRAVIYAGKNVLNFISKKGYVDKKIDEWLGQNLREKDIYVALHGILQTYWSSFSDLVKYCEREGKIVIPIKSNSAKEIYDAIADLKEKTEANIHVIGHSRGGKYALDAVIDYGLDKLVEQIILSGTPIHNINGDLQRKEYSAVGKKVDLVNIYGLNDQVLSLFGHANYGNLENSSNIPVSMGHLDLIHNKNIFGIYTKNNFYSQILQTKTLPSLQKINFLSSF